MMRVLIPLSFLVDCAAGHGAMIEPRPRSSHNQVLDDRNKCGCEKTKYGCYSKAGKEGEYCGPGCIGESCLYYAIGCFQSCGTCSYVGKTLYPVPADLVAAGCQTPPPPTLGGGDPTEERKLRTYNIDSASHFKDWTAWNPWRAPGTAGKGNPAFQPCGVNSGSNPTFPDPPAAGQPQFANGTDLPPLDTSAQSTWKAGGLANVSWSIYANHGGGYSYRLCRKDGTAEATEECYQRTPLEFATDKTEIRYLDGSRAPFQIDATTTSAGTWPTGSQWRKNPIPMCNCDIGTSCGKQAEPTEGTPADSHVGIAPASPAKSSAKSSATSPVPHPAKEFAEEFGGWWMEGKQCKAVPREVCGTKTGYNTCLTCGDGPYHCEKCCPGLTRYQKGEYAYCVDESPGTCSDDRPRACFSVPYPNSYLAPGQVVPECPTGLMFPSAWEEGAGAGIGGTFHFEMVDVVKVPDVPPGEYSLSWRWDCEQVRRSPLLSHCCGTTARSLSPPSPSAHLLSPHAYPCVLSRHLKCGTHVPTS